MTAPSGQDIAQHIAAGDLDGELATVLEAIQTRFAEGAAAMTWSINLPDLDLVIHENDLTLNEAMLIEKMIGTTWANIEPVTSAAHCRAILAVCLSQRQDLTAEEASDKLKTLKVVDLLSAIKREEINPAPLDTPL
jgi:hypothetical protein